jgi:saccharopine dehydrogenase (NAD+, L-glutamate forming)
MTAKKSTPTATRPYDVVLFGATGYTGGLMADYLATAKDDVRVAIAGRDRAKLDQIADRMAAHGRRPGVLFADIGDSASIEAMAASTTTVLTTVGPYEKYGDVTVGACVAAGTHYADITGEPTFVARIEREWGALAAERGLKTVSCCGFDSVPHDLGVFYTLKFLPRDRPVEIRGYVRAGGNVSGGTWHSLLGAFEDQSATRAAMRLPRIASNKTLKRLSGPVGRVGKVGAWVVPLPTIDGRVILRSAQEIDDYPPEFAYGHFMRMRSPLKAIGLVAGVGALGAAVKIGPARNWLRGRIKPGQGPTEEQRARGKFEVTFVARSGNTELCTRVSGGDPGYAETAKMASECALSLALDGEKLPKRFGVISPAAAMGDALLDRLQRAGILFSRVDNARVDS